MDPELARFESEQPNVKYHHVDMDQRDSPEHKKFLEYFKGRTIPFTVLIDPAGKARKEWTGYLPYGQFVSEILAVEPDQKSKAKEVSP